MCGIAGVYRTDGPASGEQVERMLDVLVHRGPDGSGVLVEGGVGLGHRRLAILDLSDAGAQPMADPTGRFVITYNGEIYNHVELRAELESRGVRFRSRCDTEVLVAAYAEWGEACLSRLNGMFGFAIFDRRERSLFCVRDRLGVKPFVYSWDGRTFGFASEHKALRAGGLVDDAMSHDAVYEYIARGYTTGGRSFYDRISTLPPGHCLRVGPGGPGAVRRWWTPPAEELAGKSTEDWADEVRHLLVDSVRLRLRSDVPVGAHLSGGLDSSAIVGAAASLPGGGDITTFTGAFRGDRSSDERRFSRSVNAYYGLRAHEVDIDVDDLAAAFENIVWHMDEPIAGPGVFPQLEVATLVARKGVTVVLGGQGGDELFGGYIRHRALFHLRRLRTASLGPRLSSALEIAGLAAREWRRVRRTATTVSDEQLHPDFLAEVDRGFREEVRRPPLSRAGVRDLMRWDLEHYLPGLLHVEDRTSMAVSVESRTPLLDYRLVELAMSIPTEQVFRRGVQKPVLREAARPWLPRSVLERRDKKGFPTPLHRWSERPALNHLVKRLMRPDGGTTACPVFGSDYLAAHAEFEASELWTVMMIQGWREQVERDPRAVPAAA
jgi:asparagine synthase (glutamine-hydrolysing)